MLKIIIIGYFFQADLAIFPLYPVCILTSDRTLFLFPINIPLTATPNGTGFIYWWFIWFGGPWALTFRYAPQLEIFYLFFGHIVVVHESGLSHHGYTCSAWNVGPIRGTIGRSSVTRFGFAHNVFSFLEQRWLFLLFRWQEQSSYPDLNHECYEGYKEAILYELTIESFGSDFQSGRMSLVMIIRGNTRLWGQATVVSIGFFLFSWFGMIVTIFIIQSSLYAEMWYFTIHYLILIHRFVFWVFTDALKEESSV